MRYPEGHKSAVRATIVEAAARALRAGGLDGISIPALMKGAGLTHGGFYSHFASRDELVAEAVECAARETAERVLEAEPGGLEATLDAYLSLGHVEHPQQGCVLAALGTEGRLQSGPVKRAFAEAARGFVRLVEKRIAPESPRGHVGDAAIRLSAQMIGAVVLARLVDDRQLAKRILRAVRAH